MYITCVVYLALVPLMNILGFSSYVCVLVFFDRNAKKF